MLTCYNLFLPRERLRRTVIFSMPAIPFAVTHVLTKLTIRNDLLAASVFTCVMSEWERSSCYKYGNCYRPAIPCEVSSVLDACIERNDRHAHSGYNEVICVRETDKDYK